MADPSRYRLQRIETAHGPVEFADTGNGPPVLYFHGTLSGSELALAVERSLIDDGFRLIVPHRPGFYQTPIEERTKAVDCANLAALVLDHVGVQRAAVIGTSAGGLPAISFAIHHPQRTAALILQCAQVHRWDAPQWGPPAHRWIYYCVRRAWSRWLFCRATSLLLRVRFWTPEGYLRDLAGDRFPHLPNDNATRHLAQEAFRTVKQSQDHAAGYTNDMAIFARDNVLADGRVTSPTLIVHDKLDPHSPFCHAEFAAGAIADSKMVTLELGGHLIWVGRDAEIMHATRVDFLRQHLAASK